MGPPCTSHFTVLGDTPCGLAPVAHPKGMQREVIEEIFRENFDVFLFLNRILHQNH